MPRYEDRDVYDGEYQERKRYGGNHTEELRDKILLEMYPRLPKVNPKWSKIYAPIPSKLHACIRNYFECYEPRENLIACVNTTASDVLFGRGCDEGLVFTINGMYVKTGSEKAQYIPYKEMYTEASPDKSDPAAPNATEAEAAVGIGEDFWGNLMSAITRGAIPYVVYDYIRSIKDHNDAELMALQESIIRHIKRYEAWDTEETRLLKEITSEWERTGKFEDEATRLIAKASKPRRNPFKKFVEFFTGPEQRNFAADAGIVLGNLSTAGLAGKMGMFHTPQGHGFAFELANHVNDLLRFRFSKHLGDILDPATGKRIAHGPDRSTFWGDLIQSKCCKTPERTVNEFLKKDYTGGNGTKPQQLECPLDQYDKCVEIMAEKIKEGKVPGVTDPAKAKDMVRKGSVTYEEARNIAKAGNFDSLKFDAINGVVSGSIAGSLSALITYGIARWNGADRATARQNAFSTFCIVGGVTAITTIVTSQIARPGTFQVAANMVIDGLPASVGKWLIKHGAKEAMEKAAAGLCAVAVTTVVLSLKDAPYWFRGRMSGAQFLKNMGVTFIGGATSFFLGQLVLSAVGGPVGWLISGLLGVAAMIGVKWLADLIVDDDSKEMVRIISFEMQVFIPDYLWSGEEIESAYKKLHGNLDSTVQEEMFASSDRYLFAENVVIPILEEVAASREPISVDSWDDELLKGAGVFLEEAVREIEKAETLDESDKIILEYQSADGTPMQIKVPKETYAQYAEPKELPMPRRGDLLNWLRGVMAEFGVNERFVVPAASFTKELGLDDGQLLKLRELIQKEFELSFSIEESDELDELLERKTVNDVTEFFWNIVIRQEVTARLKKVIMNHRCEKAGVAVKEELLVPNVSFTSDMGMTEWDIIKLKKDAETEFAVVLDEFEGFDSFNTLTVYVLSKVKEHA